MNRKSFFIFLPIVLILLLFVPIKGNTQAFVGTQGVVMPADAMGFGTPPAYYGPLWGGGYNLNSLAGGGWGGFPAGYGASCSVPGFISPECYGKLVKEQIARSQQPQIPFGYQF